MPAIGTGGPLVSSVRTCLLPLWVNLRNPCSRDTRWAKGRSGSDKTQRICHTPSFEAAQAASPPLPKQSSRGVPRWGWGSRLYATCQGGASAPQPLPILKALASPAPHHPSVPHMHYLLSTKGDWSCKCSSKDPFGALTPTFQLEHRPRPHLYRKAVMYVCVWGAGMGTALPARRQTLTPSLGVG